MDGHEPLVVLLGSWRYWVEERIGGTNYLKESLAFNTFYSVRACMHVASNLSVYVMETVLPLIADRCLRNTTKEIGKNRTPKWSYFCSLGKTELQANAKLPAF